jgi:4-amino-4-deoxy-L-arabinose transferase-like glycosyltransferase
MLGIVQLSLFFMGLTVLWIHLNAAPPTWDDSWYLSDSMRLFDNLTQHGISGWLVCFHTSLLERYKAPLICALPTPFFLILGRNIKAAFAVNVAFVPVLLGSVYYLGKRFWNPRVGLLSAFLLGSMPMIFGLSGWFIVEYGLTALVVLAVALLVASDDFTRPRQVALFSFVCGLGMLDKISFPAYIVPIVVFYAARLAYRVLFAPVDQRPTFRPLASLAALLLPALVVAGPWYVLNYKAAVARAIFSGYSKDEAAKYSLGPPLEFATMNKYIHLVMNFGMGASEICILLIAVLWLAALKLNSLLSRSALPADARPPGEIWQARLMLFFWAAPFVLFLLGVNKDSRYVAPMLPAFALVMAACLSRIIDISGRWSWAPIAALLATPLICLIQVSFQPWGPVDWSVLHTTDIHNAEIWDPCYGLRFAEPDMKYERMYQPNVWHLDQVMQELSQLQPLPHGYRMMIMTGADSIHFNSNNLQLAATKMQIPIDVRASAYYSDPELIRADVRSCSFFLFRDQAEPQNSIYNSCFQDVWDEVKNHNEFEEIRSPIVFPDGGILYIYKNKLWHY